ncbi:peptidoglycan DD-metalloendopeptidase family protein [Kitasatospora sp. NPDC101176]|uniref:peptidoglycan DD-metalloendopeptidase family protein n=1 Tax=Kitasatospora sp. NPDC101176 TaxID=3364099 RepID=UPI003830C41C
MTSRDGLPLPSSGARRPRGPFLGAAPVAVTAAVLVLLVAVGAVPGVALGRAAHSGAGGGVGGGPGAEGGAGPGVRAGPDGTRAWPVDAPGGPGGGVLGRFEPPARPWAAGHRGVDLAADAGAEVRAAAAGVVSFSGPVAGRPVVTVTHPGQGALPLRTTYLPVTGTVPVGTTVPAGAVIGRIAPGGRHCHERDCLHWGLLRGERYLDPLALFGAGAARLLPLGGDRRDGQAG